MEIEYIIWGSVLVVCFIFSLYVERKLLEKGKSDNISPFL
jgi:hypothetical protein